MPTFSFSCDTGSVPLSRILDSFAGYYGYQNGGETKAQFTTRMLRQHIIDIDKAWQTSQATQNAQDGVTPINLT